MSMDATNAECLQLGQMDLVCLCSSSKRKAVLLIDRDALLNITARFTIQTAASSRLEMQSHDLQFRHRIAAI